MPSRLVAHYADSISTPPGYSHAIEAAGLIFISGQVPLDANGSVVGVGDMRVQARQTFRNLAAVLSAAGASFDDVIKLTYFVRDIDAIADIRAVRDEFVNTDRPPASTLVEASRLVVPELLIEIEAVAVRG